MADYIDRGTAIAKLTALEVSKPNATMVAAKRLLAEVPAADVAPVVRCKDCKHEFGGSCIICGFQKRKPEDFCSYGERKEGAVVYVHPKGRYIVAECGGVRETFFPEEVVW